MNSNPIAVRLDALSTPAGPIRSPSDLRRSLIEASRLGVGGVELDARTHLRPEQLSGTAIRQIRKILEDHRLAISAVRFSTRRGYDVDERLQPRIDATKAAMRLAYSLGCNVLVNRVGNAPPPKPAEDTSGGDDPDADDAGWSFRETSAADRHARWIGVLEDLAAFGAKTGCVLAARTSGIGGPALAHALSRVRGGTLAAALDPAGLLIGGHDIAPALRSLADRLTVVYATDAIRDPETHRGRPVEFGRGDADYPSILAHLQSVDYDGPFIAGRPDTPASETADAVSHLKQLAVSG